MPARSRTSSSRAPSSPAACCPSCGGAAPPGADRESGSPVRRTSSTITAANRWDHFLARLGVRRSGHRVEPGLYALGSPTADAPVFVTANYTLSFDALREALAGRDAFILVLDTRGINVWCAAGKGTFGTDELARRIAATGLPDRVRHRRLILPQLGASGVAAHEVTRRTHFQVEYGPVRARDLPAFLVTHTATPEMRRVRFPLGDRLTVALIEVVHLFLPMVAAAAIVFLFGGALPAAAVVTALLGGVVLFPVLLPWLPTRHFASRGLILGEVLMLPFAVAAFITGAGDWWLRLVGVLPFLLALPAATAYIALMFTGSTPFTSRTGVRHEIFTYVPALAGLFGSGLVLALVTIVVRVLKGGAWFPPLS